MNQVSDRGQKMILNYPGVCLSEDINENDDQIKIDGSIECSDASHGIHVSMQSIVKLYVTTVKEGSEPLNCNANFSVTQKKDVIAGNDEVVEEGKSIKTYQKRKRQKMTQPSHVPINDLEITKEDAGSSEHGVAHRVGTTSLDQPVEIESVTRCFSESMSQKKVTGEDTISVEVVRTNKLLDKDSDCVLGFNGISSNNHEVPIAQSNENCDADMLALTFPEMENDEDTINRNSCDEARETVSSVEVCNVELEEESNFPRVAFGDALSQDSLQQLEEQSDADISLKQLECLKGVTTEVVNECGNVAIDRAFAGYSGKKLLVLDVNGLLVDISAYVPYDYDPDDIIMRKAVFKRPYCDDFLKFCFERFNVGVWTSRTKRNVEPILDFLLGNDKCKLLFCWDQSHCTHTGFTTVEKRHKPLLLKKLKKLWDKCEPDLPWERGVYNESNTLLLDDTPSKALSNPVNFLSGILILLRLVFLLSLI
ncbi:hypothetical protein PHJA_002917200 [Phtheirospermum japonicum]|uniref:Mitochondrial import inner membrane translocase subunit TIM50 n=1 Tax=Phtheirospermum japonicum TaxID=374723 RepID=A0A830DPW8_9LAMI|nr:hypothetical protein PHJA_002917200 [Phtheirospermum japonicum]